MPLHRIFHPPSAFSAKDKQELSERITAFYTGRGLPAFYVVVLFIPVEKESLFVGGKPTDNFIRIVVQHLARHYTSDEQREYFSNKYEEILAPSIKDTGYDWEVILEFI